MFKNKIGDIFMKIRIVCYFKSSLDWLIHEYLQQVGYLQLMEFPPFFVMDFKVLVLFWSFCVKISHQASMDIKVLNTTVIFNSTFGSYAKKIIGNTSIDVYNINRTLPNFFVSFSKPIRIKLINFLPVDWNNFNDCQSESYAC